MSHRITLPLAALLLAHGCTRADNVLTSLPPDAGQLATGDDASTTARDDAATTPLDGSTQPDAGGGPDATPGPDVTPPPTDAWARMPGHHGGLFRYIGTSSDTVYLMGRNLADPAMSVYRLDGNGDITQLGLSADETGSPLFPPIGTLVATGTRLLWATDSDGIVGSEDSGQTWKTLTIPWEDGSVGMGNGHVSRIVHSWANGGDYCVHREVTPWVDFRVVDADRYNEVRCLSGDQWSVETSSLAEGMRFFTAFGRELYGFTAPLHDIATGEPKICRSEDLGAHWTCFDDTIDDGPVLRLSTGRLVAPRVVDGGSDTRVFYSDDRGESWTLGLTIPEIVQEFTVANDVLYAASEILDVVTPLYAVRLSPPSLETHPRSTRAQVQWLDLFAYRGAPVAATSHGVRRFDTAAARWDDVPVESMPAIDLVTDPTGDVWTVDARGSARRWKSATSRWEEHFFDDTGWGQGNVVDHATLSSLAMVNRMLHLGAAHRKLFLVDTAAPVVSPGEDLALTAVLHPDASLWKLVVRGEELFATANGGEEVNHGTGARLPWGGGVYRRTTSGQWSSVGDGLPQRQADLGRGQAIVPSLHVEPGLIVAATHTGVYRSTNDGGSWDPSGGLPVYDALEDRTSIAGRAGRVMLARVRGTRSTLYFSTDAGARFSAVATDLPAGTVRALVAREDGFYALVDPVGVLRSTDDGRTWLPVGTVPEGTFPERTYVLRVEDTRILVGSADGVWTLTR